VGNPQIRSWIEQASQSAGLGIKTGDIGSLVSVAIEAAIGKVRQFGPAVVLSSDDVIDVKRLIIKPGRHSAVFADSASTSANLL